MNIRGITFAMNYSCTSLVCVLIVLLGISDLAGANEARELIRYSITAAVNAPKKEARLTVRRGSEEVQYVVRQVLPNKLYVRAKSINGEKEVYVIGNQVYTRSSSGWRITSAPFKSSLPFSPVKFLDSNIEMMKELEPIVSDGLSQRVFEGSISWHQGRTLNKGTIAIIIHSEPVLPFLITFKGRCGKVECAFEYQIAYDANISIEAPVP